MNFIAILLSVFFFSVTASAAEFIVTKTDDTADGTCDSDCSLREAISAANGAGGADTITLPSGFYLLSLTTAGEDANATGDLDITEDLTITGGGPTSTIIDGGKILLGAPDRIFDIGPGGATNPTVTIDGVTIQNGVSVAGGGVVMAGTGSLTLQHCAVRANESSSAGGGIATANSGSLSIDDCLIEENTSTAGAGGGIAVAAISSLSISNSAIRQNVAPTASGGGIAASVAGTATVQDTLVDQNGAQDAGGGIALTATDIVLKGTAPGGFSASRNFSQNDGGGIALAAAGTVTIENAAVDDNQIFVNPGTGGGLFLISATDVAIKSSSFSGNASTDSAGGLVMGATGSIALTDTAIDDNVTTSGNGGGLFIAGGTDVTITGTAEGAASISRNLAPIGGGALVTNTGSLTVTNVTLDDNNSFGPVGGLFHTGGTTTTISGSRIRNNLASGGFVGGVGHGGTDAFTIEDSIIEGNSITGGAGAGVLNISDTDTFLTRSLVTGNSADGAGGGVAHVGPTKTLFVTNSTIGLNFAGPQGGGIHTAGPAVLNNATVVENAAILGSGIFNAGAGVITVKNSIVSHNFFSDNCGAAVTSGGHNIEDGTSCGFTGTGDLDADPKLGSLQDNGGPTATYKPLSDSPAVDGGDPAGCTDATGGALADDQRQFPRPVDGNDDGTAVCDIGAAEFDLCGDATVQGVEECDDGNTDDTDACLTSCLNATCGDGQVQAGVETCDNGASNSDSTADACRTTCESAACGDGVVDSGEECDDGNAADDDGCSSACENEGGGGCSLMR